MTRLIVAALALALAAVGLCPASEQPGAKLQQSNSPVEIVFLGENHLCRVEVRVEVDGRPLSAVWDDTFARLFAYFDRNADGKLDASEAARLPSPIAIRHAMGNGFTPPVGAAPTFAELDRDGDGKVTPRELADFYRSAGLGNLLVGIGRLPAGAELTAAILKQLDANGDGKVTEKEWKAAAETLKKLDKNDDELIGAGELVPKIVYPGAAGTILLNPPRDDTPLSDAAASFPLLVLPAEQKNTFWAAEIIRRLDRDKDGKLSIGEAGLDADVFRRLDSDGDGKLTAAELSTWRKEEPSARWVIPLRDKPAATDRFTFSSGGMRVEGWATAGKLSEAISSSRQALTAQFDGPPAEPGVRPAGRRRGGNLSWLLPVADIDGDGKLAQNEFNAWLDIQSQIARGQVLLSVLDGGTGLFELLDINHDGALSVRELRGAWGRLRTAGCIKDGEFERTKLPRLLLVAASRGYPQTFAIDMKSGPAWFRAMDRNGDGDVSRREFTGPAEVFDKLDLDKDGLISPEEAAKANIKR